ncbi:MAG TPA: flagellar motor protein MotB [Clostridiales bacterium]|nr:MAG: hypothetical protein A2Y22_00225 [Clostridiales bacterium GWD2_32_59]HAN10535.1 flagellar motor protein MotB [Clostridiales bacterium]
MSKTKVEKDTSERWLLTYADLMNLLLIFFIILYAMSSVDQTKYAALAESLSDVMSGKKPESMIEMELDKTSIIEMEAEQKAKKSANTEEKKRMAEIENKVNELIKLNNLSGFVSVTKEERGLVISITDNILFESGSAKINEGSKGIVLGIAQIINELYANQISIEGHTDSDYIRSAQFPSNWELSADRATTVVRFLVDGGKISPERIFAVGYGEFRPKVPNTTAANKAKNRRVNIVIINSSYQGSVPPSVSNVGPKLQKSIK